ncbi:MAG: hypothetical protein M1825_004152 [Sarcosagium campestre]|nr:MAG: hypothetical protein M1825_004152 [Sarcosagium campestre]
MNCLSGLPVEAFNIQLLQEVALSIESDNDLRSFMLTSPRINAAVNWGRHGIWRRRFLDAYDASDVTDFKTSYRTRQRLLNPCPSYWDDRPSYWDDLRDLIRESNAKYNTENLVVGKNLRLLTKYATATDLPKCIFGSALKGQRTYISAICVCLSHTAFDMHHLRDDFSFETSRTQLCRNQVAAPIFQGQYQQLVHTPWLLNSVIWWRNHLLPSDACAGLQNQYRDLPVCERIGPWDGHISQELEMLCSFWQGSSICLRGRSRRRYTSVLFNNNGFHKLEIHPSSSNRPERFAKLFADIIDSPPPRSQSTSRFLPLQGTLMENRLTIVEGRLYALEPQYRIPGWRRLVMISFVELYEDNYDEDSVFISEACVLPGGHLMFGRWWAWPDDGNRETRRSGPFLFWRLPPQVLDRVTAPSSR